MPNTPDPAHFFLRKDERLHRASYSDGNAVDLFTDDKVLFAAMAADMATATGPNDFVYLANWWIDLDIPMGNPANHPPPSTLRVVLSGLAADKPVTVSDATPLPLSERDTRTGTQICAMVWQQKSQPNPAELHISPAWTMASLFGGTLLGKLNSEAVSFINAMSSGSHGILDDRTLAFGCHHQKLVVIKSGPQLIAYCGSADFHADRLYTTGSKDAKNPPDTVGAPLSDVSVRVVGPAAVDILALFCERWQLHPDANKHPLRGAAFAPASKAPDGPYRMQLTQTYGAGYPYPAQPVLNAADALLLVISRAEHYIFLEDQFLVGNDELDFGLRRALDDTAVRVIAVTTPISDVPQVTQRRYLFWKPLVDRYKDRLRIFERLGTNGKPDGPNSYLHAKLTIVDDAVFCVGSVNFNRRSWYHDSETLITVTNGEPQPGPVATPNLVQELRIARWTEYLGTSQRSVTDPLQALNQWAALSPSARVRPWRPGPPPSVNRAQNFAWNTFWDPPAKRP